jgi:hypothetical protein
MASRIAVLPIFAADADHTVVGPGRRDGIDDLDDDAVLGQASLQHGRVAASTGAEAEVRTDHERRRPQRHQPCIDEVLGGLFGERGVEGQQHQRVDAERGGGALALRRGEQQLQRSIGGEHALGVRIERHQSDVGPMAARALDERTVPEVQTIERAHAHRGPGEELGAVAADLQTSHGGRANALHRACARQRTMRSGAVVHSLALGATAGPAASTRVRPASGVRARPRVGGRRRIAGERVARRR